MEQIFDITLLSATVRMVTPILLAALGGAICAKVGLFNIALEGLIMTGAFAAVAANYFTQNLVLSILIAILFNVVLSLLFGFVTINLKANVIVAGVAMNFLAAGLTTFLLRTIFDVKGSFYEPSMVGLPNWHIPLIKDIPLLGELLSGHSPIVYLSFVLVAVLYFVFFRTVQGFRLAAVGENTTGALSVGIKVKHYQYAAVILSSVLCALAGAQLSLGHVTMFTEGMSSGRGFIALVATTLGQAHPIGVLGASFLFGFMDALSTRLQGFGIPTHFTLMMPYVITIISLFFFKDKGYFGAHENS